MDPDLGPLAVVGVVLALIGRRRRSSRPPGAGPSIGQRVAGKVENGSHKVIGTAAGLGHLGTNAVAGTVAVAGAAASTTVRTAGQFGDGIAASGLNLVAGAASRAGGLVLDGAAAVAGGVGNKLHPKPAT